MEWGPLTREDAGRLAEFWAEVEAADRAGEVFDAGDLAERLSSPLLDLAEGTLAARDGDRVIAFGHLPARQSAEGGVHIMRLWGGVHPAYRRRGLGRHVVDWAVAAAPRLGEKAFPGVPVEVHLWAYDGNPGIAALARAAGFTPVRSFADMERSLPTGTPPDAPIAPPGTGTPGVSPGLPETTAPPGTPPDLPAIATPPGVSIVAWSPELDGGARHVRNESFRDHWGTVPHTPASWAVHVTGPAGFRPECSFVALARGRAVGVLITHSSGARGARDGVRLAWIRIVGTLKEWRGRGVAGALVARALAALAEEGYERAGLTVDPDNPTGAVGVYARAGFTVTRRSTVYALTLPQRETGHEPGAGVHE
ncbi:GNAT family N-acetyltransferase [Nonomuraea candida]|uniref:GNAT family N-acetyltransferase n=1 Tax=Nonomuraea candida TaxID=359159 RepID=UPI0005BB0FC4|nr:GNAT family N-acetyltransferase [Nonomuraea candida]